MQPFLVAKAGAETVNLQLHYLCRALPDVEHGLPAITKLGQIYSQVLNDSSVDLLSRVPGLRTLHGIIHLWISLAWHAARHHVGLLHDDERRMWAGGGRSLLGPALAGWRERGRV